MFYRGAWLANVGIAWGGVIWVFAMRSGTLLSDKLFVWFALWGSVLLLYNTWTCALHKYLIWISLNFFVYVKSLNVWWFQVEDIFALVETQYYQWIILLPNKTNPYLQTTCKKKKDYSIFEMLMIALSLPMLFVLTPFWHPRCPWDLDVEIRGNPRLRGKQETATKSHLSMYEVSI